MLEFFKHLKSINKISILENWKSKLNLNQEEEKNILRENKERSW